MDLSGLGGFAKRRQPAPKGILLKPTKVGTIVVGDHRQALTAIAAGRTRPWTPLSREIYGYRDLGMAAGIDDLPFLLEPNFTHHLC